MRRIRLLALVALSLIALVLGFGQSRPSPQSVEVTSKMIASQPGGKPYVIDLTRNGRTYTVPADMANRVQIRTSKGKTTLTDLMKKLGLASGTYSTGSNFRIGTPSDLRAENFGRTLQARRALRSTRTSLKCGPFVCTCDPDIEGDCDARILYCGGPMVCWVCDGPDCPPEQQGRQWTCACIAR